MYGRARLDSVLTPGGQKLAIHDFIEDLGIPHTYIDVGWWMQLTLPLPTRSKVPDVWKEGSWTLHGAGDTKMLVTDLRHIGVFVARIIADPRTLDRSVIAWEEELTELETHEIGERASGEADVLKAKRSHVSLAFLTAGRGQRYADDHGRHPSMIS